VDITSQSTQAVPIAAAATPAQSGPGAGASAAPLVAPRMAGTAPPAATSATGLPTYASAGDGDTLSGTAQTSARQLTQDVMTSVERPTLLADQAPPTGLRADAALAGSASTSKQPKANFVPASHSGTQGALSEPTIEDATLTSKGLDASAPGEQLKSPATVSAAQALTAPEVQVTNLPDAQSAPLARTEAQGAQPVGAQAAPPPATSTVPMDAPLWPDAVADDISRAQLTEGEELRLSLTPERLGTLHIRLSVENGAAQIQIVAETAEAARALQDAQPRLADALSRVGLDLGAHTADLAGQGRDAGTGAWSDGQHQGDAESLPQGERNNDEQAPETIRFTAQPEQRASTTSDTATRIDRIA
ncbi:MAG: flagellar hook-length control protein FliK, partial [Pseudomonadota bacterium]